MVKATAVKYKGRVFEEKYPKSSIMKKNDEKLSKKGED